MIDLKGLRNLIFEYCRAKDISIKRKKKMILEKASNGNVRAVRRNYIKIEIIERRRLETMYREESFLECLEKAIKQLDDLTSEGRNYHLGYITALKDKEIITERQFKILADLILWKKKGGEK